MYICDVHLVFRSCGLNTKYSRKLESPTSLRNRVWAFLSAMEEGKEEIVAMTNLHAECHLAILKVKKIHYEIELKDYERVMRYASPEMEAFDIIIGIIEKIINKIKACDEEINNVTKWRR